MNKTYLTIALVTLLIALLPGDSHAISPAVKSNQDYVLTTEVIRNMSIMVENFGDDQLKKRYTDIVSQFQDAGESFFGQDFTNSALKFRKLKMEIISMLEVLDELYLKRTKEILDSTSKDTFGALIEYSKEGGLAAYFYRPYDPLRDIKPYDPDKYHLFHDKEKIVSYLREGYRLYYRAKEISEDPEIAVLRKKTTLTMKNIRHIIKSFSDVITLCREAKKNGIEIHRVKNINELGRSMLKYDISNAGMIPVYDDRIPEKYKVDANDNIKLIHSVEMKKILKYQKLNKQG